ncbi:O-antigen ligase family protein [Clostridium baratii]|uniref:O-antigen ligase family protein n=1 Tax=Clostridium baratii TaxID=1561 RepID=UPI0006BA90CE|nr:O-antigen ligase family protein [Clostridium baratii]
MVNEKRYIMLYFFIPLILIFNEHILYLVKFRNTIYVDIEISLVIIFCIIYINKILSVKSFDLGIPIFILFILILVTAIISNFYINQSFKEIFKAYRHMLLFLIYFPVNACMDSRKSYYYIKNFLLWLGFIFSLLAILQLVLGYNNIILKDVSYAYRFGKMRFYSGFTMVVPSFFIAFSNFFEIKKIRYKFLSIVMILIELAYFLYVTKTRNIIFAIVFSFIFVILIQKKYKKLYKLVIAMFLLTVAIIFFKDIFLTLIESSINDPATGNDRLNTISFIFDNIKNSLFLGLGMYSPEITEIPLKIHVDVGVIGFFFEYGIIGICLLIWIIVKVIKKIIYLYKINSSDVYMFIGYFTYTIIILPFNCMLNLKEVIVYFILMYTLLETKYNYCKIWKRIR